MEKSIDSYFTEILGVTYTNPREYSPLSLAYIGDSVFDLLIKTLAVTKDNIPHIANGITINHNITSWNSPFMKETLVFR